MFFDDDFFMLFCSSGGGKSEGDVEINQSTEMIDALEMTDDQEME